MKKILFFISLLFSLAATAQNKIVITSNSLNRQDSNLYVTQYQNDTGKVNIRAIRKVDTIYRTPGKDSIQYKINGLYHAIRDSVGTTDISGKLNISDTAAMWSAHPKVDSIYRTPGKDSIQYTINGRYHAIKDSSGTAGAVTSVTASLPLASTGGATPNISSHKVSSTDSGYAVTNQIIGVIGDSENGQGNVVSTGSKGFITIPFSCTITNWYVVADLSGTIQFDLKRSSTSIIGGSGNKPALSTQISANAAVANWTSTAVTAGDILEWVVDSSPAPATLTKCSVVLKVIKNFFLLLAFPASFFTRKKKAA